MEIIKYIAVGILLLNIYGNAISIGKERKPKTANEFMADLILISGIIYLILN